MKKTLLLLAAFSAIISCKKETQTPENITINLEVKNEDSPMGGAVSPFSPYSYQENEFKGIIHKDSSMVVRYSTIRRTDLNKVLEKDSSITVKDIDNEVFALSGFNNGMQFYIIDANGNKDFSDDELIEFPDSIRSVIKSNWDLLDNFKAIKVTRHKVVNGNLTQMSIPILVFPNSNYFAYRKITDSIKEIKKYQLAGETSNYFYGEFKIDSNNYKIAGADHQRKLKFTFSAIESEFYSPSDTRRQDYLLNDTLRINKNYFRIDSLTNNPFKLHLKKLQITENMVGFRIGQVSKDFAIEDLEGNTTSLSKMFNNKDHLLIDFWGTWCGPCKELTPDIKDLYSKYNSKLELASIAYEQDPTPVKEYATANNFTWFNGIVKGKPKSGLANAPKLIKELRVQSFPTFLLLDKDLKIVHRTVGGGSAFEELETFIKNL